MCKLIKNRLAIGSLISTIFLSGFVPFTPADEVKLTPVQIQKILEKDEPRPVLPAARRLRQTDPAAPLILEALEFARVKQYEKALQILREAIDEYPESAFAYYHTAWVYAEMEQWGNALEFSGIAISLEPKLAEAHFLYGLANSKLGRYEKAATSYRDAVYHNPHDAESYNNLGNTLIFLKEYNAAVEAYRQAIEINPSNADTYNNLGEAYRQLEWHPEAIAVYRLAIERRADFAIAYANMSASQIALEEYEAAAESLAHAVKLEPSRIEWRYNLAAIALGLNKREVAIKQLHAMQKLPPNALTARLEGIFTEFEQNIGRVIRLKENQLTQSIIKGDTGTLEKLLADNYRFAGLRHVSNKAKELQSSSLLVPSATVESISTDKVTIKHLGNEISVKGQMIIQSVRAGESLCGRFAFERVYHYQAKRWQIVTEKITPLFKQKTSCGSTNNYLKNLPLGRR